MLLDLSSEYDITSSRELGYGRHDVLVLPKERDRLAVVSDGKKVWVSDEE